MKECFKTTIINCVDQALPNKIKQQENEKNNDTNEDSITNLNIKNSLNLLENDQYLKANYCKKKIFQCTHKDILNNFKIFHPGNNEELPRKIIDLISEKRTNITLSQRQNLRKQRKNNSDNIRKKIKARFLKSLKDTLNQRLKYAGSIYFFNYLPSNFITNIAIFANKGILNKTFKQIFSEKFGYNDENAVNFNKRQNNILVIRFLEENETISEKSYYKYYNNMKYSEIYEEYLKSREFEEDIISIKAKEGIIYLEKYIDLALNLNNFFNMNNQII